MNKLSLLITEDEIAIANLIKSLIEFDQLDLEFLGIALNGQSAYEMILKKKPDIVITDISMPVMNGLDLIEKVHNDGIKDIYFILISGLNNFDYAISAIKMGVEDYLLKPINKDELNDVIEKTIVKIASSRKLNYQIKALSNGARLGVQRMRRSFLMNILYEKEPAHDFTEERINKEYRFSFQHNTAYMMGIVLIDGILSLNLVSQNAMIEQMMRSFVTELKSRCIDLEVYNKNNQFIFLLNYLPDQENAVLGAVSAISEELSSQIEGQENLRLTISCGISVNSLTGLTYSLNTSQKTLNARLLKKSNSVLIARELFANNKKPVLKISNSDMTYMHSCIEINDYKKLDDALLQLFKKAVDDCKTCPQYILDTFCDVVSFILSDLYQHKIITINITETYLRYRDLIEQIPTLNELASSTIDFIHEYLPDNEETTNQDNRQIQTAKEYIINNFNKNLKLEDVAAQVYLAPSYFGVLFKKETGESFSSYITSIRIDKAKEMLHDVQYNINEISSAIGYQDKRYFSKLFKEHVGVTPKEYRKIYAD